MNRPTKNRLSKPPADAVELNLIELMVRMMSAVVAEIAAVMHPDGDSDLKTTAWLYRNLEKNCRVKAEMAEALAAEETAREKQTGT